MHENEWRLFAYEEKDKIYADIVSSIIVDKSIINHRIIREILSFAKKRKWGILIRSLNKAKSEYEYIKYD